MSIVITTKKVIRDGKKYREILHISALPKEQLPEKYLEAPMHCYMLDEALMVNNGTSTFCLMPCSILVEEEVYQALLKDIRQCGRRLKKINLHHWHGEEMEVI